MHVYVAVCVCMYVCVFTREVQRLMVDVLLYLSPMLHTEAESRGRI